jgi:cytochrome c oxidase subunit 2
LAIAGAGTLGLAGCKGELSALDPAGPAARDVATLWWVMLGGAAVILAGVVGTALYALRKNRGARTFSARRVLIGGGLVFPVVTLLLLMGFAFLRGEQMLAREEANDGVIRAHSQQWAWTFEYPGGQRTRNVLHVPAGEEFTLALTSEDVIHSFWVPRLGGKMDAIPGKVNRLRLEADAPGTYRGICAEYCGIGHAHMQVEVRAHPPGEYRPALLAAADQTLEAAPVLRQRPAPAATIIESWADYLLGWLGIT